jgi:hypothetical protein
MWRFALEPKVSPLAVSRAPDFTAGMKRLAHFQVGLAIQVLGFNVACAIGVAC